MQLFNRIGQFSITQTAIREAPEIVRAVLGSVIVIRAEFMLATDQIDYVAYGDAFDVVPQGSEAPSYDVAYDEGEITWTRVA